MPPKEYYTQQLELGKYYHIFNRSIAREQIFATDFQCIKFLQGIRFHLLPQMDILSYCLLPNHFHLFVRVKTEEENVNEITLRKSITNFFREFSVRYNRLNNRTGPVFASPFKRKEIDSIDFFTQIIYYIHMNPVHHNVSPDFVHYRWSSYKGIISENTSNLAREIVLEWFNGIEEFEAYHRSRHLHEVESFEDFD